MLYRLVKLWLGQQPPITCFKMSFIQIMTCRKIRHFSPFIFPIGDYRQFFTTSIGCAVVAAVAGKIFLSTCLKFPAPKQTLSGTHTSSMMLGFQKNVILITRGRNRKWQQQYILSKGNDKDATSESECRLEILQEIVKMQDVASRYKHHLQVLHNTIMIISRFLAWGLQICFATIIHLSMARYPSSTVHSKNVCIFESMR